MFSRSQVLASGIDDAALQATIGCCIERLAAGIYVVIRVCGRGPHRRFQYFLDDDPLVETGELTRWERDRFRHLGWLTSTTRPRETDVISHRSAAMVHGLPLLSTRLPVIEVSNPQAKGTTAGLRRRLRAIPEPDRAQWSIREALSVTTPARTAADLMRDCGWQSGIIAAEHFVGSPESGPASRRAAFPLPSEVRTVRKAQLAAVIDRMPDGRGSRRMAAIVDYSDGLSESPAESLAVLGLCHLGIRDLEQQARLFGPDGRFVARVDFLIERLGLVLEVDGDAKYLADHSSRWVDRRVFDREKDRENAIRFLGFRVVRLRWKDVVEPANFSAAMRRAGVLPSGIPR